MRFSVVIELNDSIREHLVGLQDGLRDDFPKTSWLLPEQLFLTIKFLGGPRGIRVGKLRKALRDSAAQVPPMELGLGSCSVFPEEGPARVLWVGVEEQSGMLRRFRKECDRAFEKLRVPKPKGEFVPHIVLGRAEKHNSKGALRRAFTALAVDSLELRAGAAALLQSKLTKSGPHYEVLERADFSAKVL